MTTILHLDASARRTRSISRDLGQAFLQTWLALRPHDQVVHRDLALDLPPHVSETWIAAAFTPIDQRDDDMRAALRWSDRAIDEVERADLILVGTPMYNYGMPSALKAWFDQVIRIERTFSFDLSRGDWPLEPVLSAKRLVVLSSRGEFGFASGGVRHNFNHLDPHIATCARYLGVAPDAIDTVTVEYQEFGDARHDLSRASATREAEALARKLAQRA